MFMFSLRLAFLWLFIWRVGVFVWFGFGDYSFNTVAISEKRDGGK